MMGPRPVMAHEKPAAFLLLCLKYVLTARDEADTLIPAPKPSKKKRKYLFCYPKSSKVYYKLGLPKTMAYVIIYSINVSQNAVRNIPRNISKEPAIATWRNVKRLNIGPLSRPEKTIVKFYYKYLQPWLLNQHKTLLYLRSIHKKFNIVV